MIFCLWGLFFSPFILFLPSCLSQLTQISVDCSTPLSSLTIESNQEILLQRGCEWKVESPLVLSRVSNVIVSDYGSSSDPLPKISPTQTHSLSRQSSTPCRFSGLLGGSPHPDWFLHVLYEGSPLNVTRYPRDDSEFYHFASDSSNDSPDFYYDDGEVSAASVTRLQQSQTFIVCRPKRGIWFGEKIVSVDPGTRTVTLASSHSRISFPEGYGFKILNVLTDLEDGDYFYDFSTGELAVQIELTPSGTTTCPDSIDVEVTGLSDGIELDDVSDVTISNIHVFGASDGINAHSDSHDVTISNCRLERCHRGLRLEQTIALLHFMIRDNEILDSQVYGIRSQPFNYGQHVISGNVIQRVLYEPYTHLQVQSHSGVTGVGSGMFLATERTLVERNRIEDIAYNSAGVYGPGNVVQDNVIRRGCLLLEDGGAIYAWGQYSKDSVWQRNFVSDQRGSLNGKRYDWWGWNSDELDNTAVGLYADDECSNITMLDNVVVHTYWGALLHGNERITLKGNIFIGSRDSAVFISDDFAVDYAVDYVFEDNVFISTLQYYDPVQRGVIAIESSYTDVDNLFASMDRNIYYAPKTVRVANPPLLTVDVSGSSKTFYHSIEAIRQDAPSQFFPSLSSMEQNGAELQTFLDSFDYEWFADTVVLTSEDSLLPNGDFASDITGWASGWSSDGDVSSEWSSDYGGSLRGTVSTGTGTGSLTWSEEILPILDDTDYLVQLDVTCNASPEETLSAKIAKGPPTFDVTAWNWQESLPSVSTEHRRLLYRGTEDWATSRLVLHTSMTSDFVWGIDNVTLHQLDSIRFSRVSDQFVALYNDQPVRRDVPMPIPACDWQTGEVVESESITLDPYESRLLVQCFCNRDGRCNNLENANTCPEDGCIAICGNGVCETATESLFNCWEDCVSTSILAAIIGGSIGLVVLVVVVVIVLLVLCCCCIRSKKKNHNNGDDVELGRTV